MSTNLVGAAIPSIPRASPLAHTGSMERGVTRRAVRGVYLDVKEHDDFSSFVHATAPQLHRAAVLLTGDHHLAEDLTQATYAKVYAAWRRVDGDPLAYARRTLLNTYISHRRLRRNTERPVDLLGDTAAREVDPSERIDVLDALATLSAVLDPTQAPAVVPTGETPLEAAAAIVGAAMGVRVQSPPRGQGEPPRDPLAAIKYPQNQIENTGKGNNPYIYPSTDWRDVLFKKYTQNRRANLSVSGGGEVAQYYVATSFSNDNGMLKVDKMNNFNNNVKLNSYSVRSNVNINLGPQPKKVKKLAS